MPRRRWGGLLLLLLMAAAACSEPGGGNGTELPISTTEHEPRGQFSTLEPGVISLDGQTNVDAALAMSGLAFESAPAVLLGRDDLFADALAAAGAQRRLQAPMLLMGGVFLPAGVRAELERLGARTVYVLGGPGAVSDGLVTSLRTAGFQVQRLAGANRFATAALVAERFYPDARGAILARGTAEASEDDFQLYVDALGAGAAAAATGQPLLLTEADRLPAETRTSLESSAIEALVIVGGQDVVDDAVAAEIRELGIAVTRVAGRTRYATAARLAGMITNSPVTAVTLVDGDDPQAWASGFPAAALGAPVLLSAGDALPAETIQALRDLPEGATLVCAANVATATCARAGRTVGSPEPR
jgi:putative cell wall-binding protein